MAKGKRISAKEFVGRCTRITMRYLSQLPADERKKRVEALQKAAATAISGAHRTPSVDREPVSIRLAARDSE